MHALLMMHVFILPVVETFPTISLVKSSGVIITMSIIIN